MSDKRQELEDAYTDVSRDKLEASIFEAEGLIAQVEAAKKGGIVTPESADQALTNLHSALDSLHDAKRELNL